MKKICLIYAFILACTLQFATAQEYILTSVAKKGATYLNVAEDSLLYDLNYGEMCVAVNLNIDLMTGEASGNVEATFGYNNILDDGFNYPYDSKCLFFNYLLVSDNKSLVEIEHVYTYVL